MSDNDTVFSILGQLDKERAAKLRKEYDSIEKRKEDYERAYHIQFDEYKLHNSRFGGNKKGIEPTEYNKMLDKELLETARSMRREQQEARREKREQEKQDKLRKQLEEEKNMDPRRVAFRQRMRELDEQRNKDKDKDKEQERD